MISRHHTTNGQRRRVMRRAALFMFAALIMLIGNAFPAYGQMNITPVTWDVIGVDSNAPATQGPNSFQIGARICNTSPTVTQTNVTGNFVWDSFNSAIALAVGNSPTITYKSLAPLTCTDMYFTVDVVRAKASHDQFRRYRITVSSDQTGVISTPAGRQLYVEKLISQARNSTDSIIGPSTVYVGQTYQYTLNASTATQGYEQLEAFLTLSNVIFRVTGIATTYTAPAGATNNKFYADACGWDNNPLSPNYKSCIGPPNYTGGKAGGTVNTVYTVKILSTGTTTAGALILDFSGSSYHYNADFGSSVYSITSTSLPPPITLSKLTSVASLGPTGGVVTYTLRVTNVGPAGTDYTLVDFVDTPATSPASPVYVAGSSSFNGVAIPNPVSAGGKLTWAGSFLVPAGQSRDLTYQMTIPATPGTYVNTAIGNTADFQVDTTQSAIDNVPASASVVVPAIPDLQLTKTHPAAFSQGGTGSYILTARNTGNTPTTDLVTVTDTLPAGFEPTSASGTGWTCNVEGQDVTCTRSDALAAGASYPAITIGVAISITAVTATNTATVAGGGESDTTNNSASDPTPVTGVPNLVIVKSHTDTFTRGSTATYNLLASNTSSTASSGLVTVTDTLPAGLVPVSAVGAGWACTVTAPTVSCTRSDALPASSSYPAITLTVSVDQTAAASLINTVTISGGSQTYTADDTSSDTTAIVSSADLSVTKTVDAGSPTVGQTVVFTVTITNAGPSDATGIQLTDQLPAALTLVSAVPSQGAYVSGTGIWSAGAIASDTSATLVVTATVNAAGAATNTAELTAADQPDPNSTPNNNNASENDQASVTLNSFGVPAVVLTKAVLPMGTQLPGTELVFTIGFENTGSANASGFEIVDPDPTDATLSLSSDMDYKLGTAAAVMGSSGLLGVTVAYSNDGGLSFSYVPVSGAGGAPAGYDRLVTHIRWAFTGSLGFVAPNNSGNVSFTSRIR